MVNSNIEAERDHLRVGDQFVRILTMKEAIVETRPLVLDRLLKIEGNVYVVTEWTPLSVTKARKKVDKRRRHFNMSESGFLSQLGSDPSRINQRDVLIDQSKQADIETWASLLARSRTSTVRFSLNRECTGYMQFQDTHALALDSHNISADMRDLFDGRQAYVPMHFKPVIVIAGR